MVVQTEVPKFKRPLLVDPEFSIPRTAEILFSRDASGRRALVYGAFADDALYYNTFVSPKAPLSLRLHPSISTAVSCGVYSKLGQLRQSHSVACRLALYSLTKAPFYLNCPVS